MQHAESACKSDAASVIFTHLLMQASTKRSCAFHGPRTNPSGKPDAGPAPPTPPAVRLEGFLVFGVMSVTPGEGVPSQCTPCILRFIQGANRISTKPAPIGMSVKIRKKKDME